MAQKNDFTVTRIFDAPREMVYAAWTDPVQFAKWWGPHGFTTPVAKLDWRPGGAWNVVMRSPDGHDQDISGKVREVVPQEKLVMTVLIPLDPPVEAVMTVLFEAQGNKTRLTATQTFPDGSYVEEVKKVGAAHGWELSFQRLDQLLAR